jgi:hypothetical protein
MKTRSACLPTHVSGRVLWGVINRLRLVSLGSSAPSWIDESRLKTEDKPSRLLWAVQAGEPSPSYSTVTIRAMSTKRITITPENGNAVEFIGDGFQLRSLTLGVLFVVGPDGKVVWQQQLEKGVRERVRVELEGYGDEYVTLLAST